MAGIIYLEWREINARFSELILVRKSRLNTTVREGGVEIEGLRIRDSRRRERKEWIVGFFFLEIC